MGWETKAQIIQGGFWWTYSINKRINNLIILSTLMWLDYAFVQQQFSTLYQGYVVKSIISIIKCKYKLMNKKKIQALRLQMNMQNVKG